MTEYYLTQRVFNWMLEETSIRRAVLEAAPFGPKTVEGIARTLSDHFIRRNGDPEAELAADLVWWAMGLVNWEKITADLMAKIESEQSLIEESKQ